LDRRYHRISHRIGDTQVPAIEPDVRFNADEPVMESIEEWILVFVVVMGMSTRGTDWSAGTEPYRHWLTDPTTRGNRAKGQCADELIHAMFSLDHRLMNFAARATSKKLLDPAHSKPPLPQMTFLIEQDLK